MATNTPVDPPAQPAPAPASSPGGKTLIATVVAFLGAAAYAWLSYQLLKSAQATVPMPEISWSRALIIYNGVASVGFACIGVLLGSSVQMVSMSGVKADAAQKGDAIKKAIGKLSQPVQGQPGDMGGGPAAEDSRAREAMEILYAGLR